MQDIAVFLLLYIIFFVILAILLFISENNKRTSLTQLIKCKFGKHKYAVRFGKHKRALYYCNGCKKPRNHPKLKLILSPKKLFEHIFEY